MLPVIQRIYPVSNLARRSLHLTSVLETKKAGRHKISTRGDKPLTYEQANKPDMICVRKAFNSFNTSALFDGLRPAECAQEDVFIRKFVHGTWPRVLASEVVIKRAANQIVLSFMAIRSINPQKMYFMIGYTEEILSYILKCVVKLEIQTITDPAEMTYKYI